MIRKGRRVGWHIGLLGVGSSLLAITAVEITEGLTQTVVSVGKVASPTWLSQGLVTSLDVAAISFCISASLILLTIIHETWQKLFRAQGKRNVTIQENDHRSLEMKARKIAYQKATGWRPGDIRWMGLFAYQWGAAMLLGTTPYVLNEFDLGGPGFILFGFFVVYPLTLAFFTYNNRRERE